MCFFKKKIYPEFWHVYKSKFKNKSTEFVVIDTETTGLNYKKDQILTVGAVRIVNNTIQINQSIEWHVNSNFELNDSVLVHGILPQDNINNNLAFIEPFLEFIGNATLIGHHVDFDIKIINQLLLNNGLNKLKNNILDNEKMYKKLKHWSQEQHIGLDDLLKEFNIKPIGRHTALGDAYSTALAFLKLKDY